MDDPLFVEFLETHGQENILKDIEEVNKSDDLSTQKIIDEKPTNKIANTDISDFEVWSCFYKIYLKLLFYK